MESRILPRQDPLVDKLLKDFRFNDEDGITFIAQIHGAGKFRSSVSALEPENVLLEFESTELWDRPVLWKRWLTALRLPYLAFSLFPLFLVLCAYWKSNFLGHWNIALSAFFATAFLHISCNLWDDYEDHLRGVDSPESEGGSGVIRKLWIPAIHLRNTAAMFFIIGLFLGASMLFELSWESSGKYLLWIGLLGTFAAASFSGWPFHYKYLALGEPIIFLMGGPLITLGAVSIFFQDADYFLWFILVSLPLAFLAILRLHLGNMKRIPFDIMAGSRTIANIVGFANAKKLSFFLLLAPFFVNFLLCWLELSSWISFSFTLLSLPFAILTVQSLSWAKGPLDPVHHQIRKQALRFHFCYGFFYSLSFLF